jgi:GxxExxY protein
MNHRDSETQSRIISGRVVNAAFAVHSKLGPGLLESVYERCMVQACRNRGLYIRSQVILPIGFEGLILASGLRIDLLVENTVIVEIKAVEVVLPVHKAQLLTYLRLSGFRVGLLINFNVPLIKDGITRMVV